MINQIGAKNYVQSFGTSAKKADVPEQAVKLNYADEFIKEVNKQSEIRKKGSFYSKYFGYTTALIVSMVPALTYEFYNIFKSSDKAKKLPTKIFMRNFGLLLAGGLALNAGLVHILNSRTDKNFEKLKKEFDKINTSTDAKLAGTFKSGLLGASCNSANGNITINENILNDPIFGRNLEKMIRHELVHARQFETIARSKDGIEKLNFATFANIRNTARNNPIIKNEFMRIYNDVENDKSGKYDNIKININGDEYNFKKYIEMINILITKEDVTYKDLPVIIDTEHYTKVIEKKGKLTPEEEAKADEYFKALTDYTNVTFANAFNPFGGYRSNILEQEAYKENPSLFMRLFGKN